jgi:CRISPR/Cas system-associated protein Cas7 (RAMP superfamily)
MEATPQNIYLVYKKKFEETGSLEAKAVMEEYKEFAPVEVEEVKKFTLPPFTGE